MARRVISILLFAVAAALWSQVPASHVGADHLGAPLERKVIIMRGIDSKGWDDFCTTDHSADSAGQLKDSLVGFAGLSADDIYIVSWSGEYCDTAFNRFRPKYDERDTCGGAREGALKVGALVNRVLSENPSVEFDLIGHSLGGLAISFWVATQHPDFVRSRIHSVITLDSMI